MYWTILVNVVPDFKDGVLRSVFDYSMLDTRWGDEAKFRQQVLSGNSNRGLIKITVYDVQPLWHKNNGRNGHEDDRCADDVIGEIKDHLYYCGHDVVSSQLDMGVP